MISSHVSLQKARRQKPGLSAAGVSITDKMINAVMMADLARESGFTFPYLYDETQGVAKAFSAACTPDFFLFDGERALVYRGQLDGSRPGNAMPVTGADLTAAIDAVLGGKPVAPEQKPSMGCNIKWKQGNEPQYA